LKYRWAVEYTVPNPFGIQGDMFFRYDASYQGETFRQPQGWDTENDTDEILPSWTTANLQTGMDFDNGWSANLFVRNVWNETGTNYLGSYHWWLQDSIPGNADRGLQVQEATLQRPRTISLSVTKRF